MKKVAYKKAKAARRDPDMLYNLEGMLDYFNAKSPRDDKDRRVFGWNLGRQFVALYLTEIFLKCAYAKYHDDGFPHTHNLKYLFQRLPAIRRKAVEKKYKRILNSRVEWTWDVFRTVESFLTFLGRNPITETRYYWDKNGVSNTLGVRGFQGLMAPNDFGPLIYALCIVLHDYPSAPLVRRYDTKFPSLKRALRQQSASSVMNLGARSDSEDNKSKRRVDPLLKYNLEGVLDYFHKIAPMTDRRMLGWNIGRQVIAQYLVEIFLKCDYAENNNGVFPRIHNLECLFSELSLEKRRAIEEKYRELLNSEVQSTWNVFKTVESFLRFLGDSPITETRYYWDNSSASNTLGVDYFQALVSPDSYRPLVYSLYIVLHGYPSRPILKRYDTLFMSLKDSLKDEPGSE